MTATFNAEREHGVIPLDPDIGLAFPESAGDLPLSPKDAEAPEPRRGRGIRTPTDLGGSARYYATLNEAA